MQLKFAIFGMTYIWTMLFAAQRFITIIHFHLNKSLFLSARKVCRLSYIEYLQMLTMDIQV